MLTRPSHEPDLAARLGDAPFRLLADHLPALCWMADPDGTVLWCNRRWYDYTGVADDADPARSWPAVQDPGLLQEIGLRWEAAIARGTADEMVLPLRGRDGRYRPFLTRAEPVRDADGRISCWLGTMTEISSQQEAERNQRFLLDLNDALRDETDPDAILVIVGNALAAHLEAARVGYGEVDPDREVITAAVRGWSDGTLPGEAGDYRLLDFGPVVANALKRGETCAIADVSRNDMTKGHVEAYRALGISALLCIPLIKRGRLAAVLYVHGAAPHGWHDSEIRLVEEVAERTWAILERARAEAGRRESDERLRLALDGAFLGTAQWDLATSRGRWSKRTCDILGVENGEDVTVEQFRELVHPDDRQRVFRTITEALRSGDQYAAEYRVVRPDGGLRWVVSRARVQRNEAGKAVGTVGLVLDITDRKLAEERLRESEERLRAIVETTPECVKIVDRDGCLIYMNPAGLEMIEADRLEHVDVAELVAPEYRRQWRANHARVCAGESVTWEFDVIGMKGARRRMETHAVPLPLPDGTFQQLAVTRDITARRRAEERLRESEALLAAFMKHAPIGMYLKDADGRYLLANPEMAKVFGKPVEEVVGRTAAELFGSEEAAMVAAFDREILETGRPHRVEEFLPEHDSYAWSMVVRFPVSLEGEQPTRIGGFDIDISDRKRAEAELERSREALYQSEKLTALGSLLAGVSHELNNPLSIILTLATLLESKTAGTEHGERARKIRTAAERCARIVQTFLAMARQKAPVRGRVDANDVVRTALELTGYTIRTAGIEILTRLAPDLPPLWADADQLTQVLVNLIVNAQQALEEKAGQRVLQIHTSASRDGIVRIEVVDNGPGVPLELRRRIFEPFFTSKPQGVGTGIGLALSLGIVEAHDGSLQLTNPPEGGACFVVELPAMAGGDMADVQQGCPERPGVACGAALVVDDEDDLGEALGELLEQEGFRVDLAGSGREAQALLAQGNYDVVLSDLRMPDIDGAALFDWIERERPDLVPRIAFVTGDTLGSAAGRFLARAGRPVLEKPFDADGLHRLLAELGRQAARPSAIAANG